MLLFSSLALASGYYFIDSGTRAIGRGGAFIAGADDQSAQYYNPAALSNIERTMINLNVWGANQWVTFDREDEAGLEPFEPVENAADPIIEPQAGVVFKLGGLAPALQWTTLAVGWYVPTAPYLSFPEEGAQRYSVKDELVWQLYAGPSIAQQLPFAPWITVGGGLQYTFLRVEQSLDAILCYSVCPTETGQSEDPAEDIALELSAWDTMEWSGNFGILVQPAPWIKIGASAQPPISYDAPGTLVSDISEDTLAAAVLESTHAEDDDVRLLLTVPWVIRAGVEVNPVEPLKVELAGTWLGWSLMEDQVITDLDLALEGTEDGLLGGESIVITDDIVFKTGFQDAWSVRLGGDWTFSEHAKIRLGGFYETSALPDSYLGQSLVDRNKFGYGLGATFTVADRVAFDLGVGHQIFIGDDVSDSELRQQTLNINLADITAPPTVGLGKPIGNGHYEAQMLTVGVGASVLFGKAGQ